MAEIYVNIKMIVALKKWEGERKLANVLVKCLGRTWIGDICFHVNILRLSQICSLGVYIVMGGWLSQLFHESIFELRYRQELIL